MKRTRFASAILLSLALVAGWSAPAFADGIGKIVAVVTQLLGGRPPSSSGTSGQFLQTDGAGSLTWATASSSQTLAQTLTAGQVTGGRDIKLSSGDSLTGATGSPCLIKTASGQYISLSGINSEAFRIQPDTLYNAQPASGYVALMDPVLRDNGVNSATAATVLYVAPQINYTGATRSGSYTALQIDATETSLPTGTNYLLRMRAGAAGTTDEFAVTNGGLVEAVSGTFAAPSYTFLANQAFGFSFNGTNTVNVSGLFGQKYAASTSGDSRSLYTMYDDTAVAAGVGGGFAFGGRTSGAPAYGTFCGVSGYKETSSTDDAGTLNFWTSNGSSTYTAWLGITSGGIIRAKSTAAIGFSSGSPLTTAADTAIYRDGAGVTGFSTGGTGTANGSWKATNGTLSGSLNVTNGGNNCYLSNNGSAILAVGGSPGGTTGTVLCGSVSLGSTITRYNGTNTAAWGAPAIYASGRANAQSGAKASLTTYTPTADGSFEVVANVLVTTATSHSFTVTCTYTDEGNTARTLTMPFLLVAGSTITNTIANAAGAVPYMGIPVRIRVKANTAITIQSTGTFTTVTYNIEADIKQVS